MSQPPPPIPHRGLGYKRDFPDPNDLDLPRMLARRVGVVKTFAEPDLRRFRRQRLLQGNAGSCWAFANAAGLHKCLQIQHADVPPADIPIPSPWFLYFNGRAQEYRGRDPDTITLSDSGTFPRVGMQSIRNVGFCAWDDAPYVDTAVNIRPARAAYRKAYDQRGFTYGRLPEAGAPRVDAIVRALQEGCPVQIGMQVDTAFLNNMGETIKKIDFSRIEGGHMIDLEAVIDRGGERVAIINNTWDQWGIPTEKWQDGGRGALSLDVLMNAQIVTDCYAVYSAPMQLKEAA